MALLSGDRGVPKTQPASGDVNLKHGVLSTIDLAGTSAAVVAPAYSVYTTAAFIVAAVGLGSPLLVLLAGIGFLCYGNSMAQFARKLPSAGSQVAFVGKAFGGRAGSVVAFTGLITGLGSGASVAIVPGWWTSVAVQTLTGYHLAWWIPFIVIYWSMLLLTITGIKLSTRIAVNFMILEVLVLLAAGIVALTLHPSAISAKGFLPSNISGFSAIGIAFPLAYYMYEGAQSNISLSDETSNARRRQPRVTYWVIVGAIVLYAFLTWAPLVGYNYDLHAYAAAEFPLVDVVQATFGGARFLLYLAGWTSSVALLIAGMNSNPRVLMRAAREGMLPIRFGHVSWRWRTPVFAMVAINTVTFAIALVIGLSVGPETAFGYTAGYGGVAGLIIAISISIALIVYYWRDQRQDASWLWHGVVPVLGCLVLFLPLWELVKPGAQSPNWMYPYISLAVIVVGVIYATYRRRSGIRMVPGTMIIEDDAEASGSVEGIAEPEIASAGLLSASVEGNSQRTEG